MEQGKRKFLQLAEKRNRGRRVDSKVEGRKRESFLWLERRRGVGSDRRKKRESEGGEIGSARIGKREIEIYASEGNRRTREEDGNGEIEKK